MKLDSGLAAAAHNAKHQLFLARKNTLVAKKSIALSLDRKRRRISRQVRAGMRLPSLPNSKLGQVWAVSMVKNEEDVIAEVVQHFFDQGIDAAIIADNGSTDGTRECLEELRLRFPIFIADDFEVGYFQAQKMDLLARWAQRAGAEWIIPFDADEFWFGVDGDLRQTLTNCRSPIASALVYNMFPYELAASNEPQWMLDTNPSHLRKVAFKVHPLAKLVLGNHAVIRPGSTEDCLRVIHQPYRSFEHFCSKLRGIAPAFVATGELGHGSERAFNKTKSSVPAADWRATSNLSTEELRREWSLVLSGNGPTRVAWFRTGEVVACDPRCWHAWDPEGIVSSE